MGPIDIYNELRDVFAYFLNQIDLSPFEKYVPYLILSISIILTAFIVIKIVRYKRRVREYIPNPVCIYFNMNPMVDGESKYKEICSFLISKFKEEYEGKMHFAVEVFKKRGGDLIYFILPNDFLEKHGRELNEFCKYKNITEDRGEFFKKLNPKKLLYLDFQLGMDFVYPLNVNSVKFDKLKFNLETNEWLFVQLLFRPIENEKWHKAVNKFTKSLKQGKNPQVQSGCIGSFLSITGPFFELLANLLTSIIHGSGKSKEGDSVNENADLALKEDLDKIQSKISPLGCETELKVVSTFQDEERKYKVLNSLISLLADGNDGYNFFSVEEFHEKIKKSSLLDVELAFLSGDVLDILNEKEINYLIDKFL